MRISGSGKSRDSRVCRSVASAVWVTLIVFALVAVLPAWAVRSESQDLPVGSDAEAYASYQRAVAEREAGNVRKAWRAITVARKKLPEVGLPLTRALLVELSIQLGERKLQTELWETYQLVVGHWAATAGPYADETLTLRADYGTELVRKGRFERGHDELLALIELFEDPPAGVSLDPSPETVHQILANLGLAKVRRGDLEGGVKYVERARDATPELTQMWERWLMAETFVELKRYNAALPQFSLLDPMMEETYPFAHPARAKFRKLYSKALRKVGNPEYADRISARSPPLKYERLPASERPRVATGDEPGFVAPVLIEKKHFDYPSLARLQRISGVGSAKILVSSKGRVVDAVMISCTPAGHGFEAEMLDAVYLCATTLRQSTECR